MAVYDAPKLSRATPDRGGEGKDGFSGGKTHPSHLQFGGCLVMFW